MMSDYRFDGAMSEQTLRAYLSRAVTHTGFGIDNLYPSSTFEDDLRMLHHEGTKFVGRASFVWNETDEKHHFEISADRARRAHGVDPEMILQGCIFECIEPGFVNTVPIPGWVLKAFGLPEEERCFSYDAMLNPDGTGVDHWYKDSSVPDITRPETQMWFYYRACSYILASFEALHFGQVHLIGAADRNFECWYSLLGRIREFAHVHGRRHFVLCDAHTHGITVNGKTLFDYNAWPLRLKEDEAHPMKAFPEDGYLDSIYGKSLGGTTPSGWSCGCLPYFVEIDNFGEMPDAGKPTPESYYVWGFDEITWYSLLPAEERHVFLRKVHDFVRARGGYLEMPSRRCLTREVASIWKNPDPGRLELISRPEFLRYSLNGEGDAVIGRSYYNANRQSDACPFGSGDEDAIAAIWTDENREETEQER